jgi:hypothetical protein
MLNNTALAQGPAAKNTTTETDASPAGMTVAIVSVTVASGSNGQNAPAPAGQQQQILANTGNAVGPGIPNKPGVVDHGGAVVSPSIYDPVDKAMFNNHVL